MTSGTRFEDRSALHCFFSPTSVAVIGATDREGSVGRTVVRNLLAGTYKGRVYAVNPRREEVCGLPCYPSIHEVPEAVDLVVVVTPADTVPGCRMRMRQREIDRRDFCRVQRKRARGSCAGKANPNEVAGQPDSFDRSELTRSDESVDWTECHVRAGYCAMNELIETKDLTKTYTLGEVTVNALQGVTVTIDRGSFVAIMGASGSGKSTLMNLLGCLDRPTSGRYSLDGVPVEGLDRDQLAEIRNEKIGFVFQNFNLLPRMSAMENVQLPLLYKSGESGDADQQARRVLALVGLAGREHSLPTQLSGGQQQRIAIARALINEPEILLADEPTGQLDSHTSAEIMDIFLQLNRTHGITIVVVTHSDEVARFASRIITFRDGRIVSDNKGLISPAPAAGVASLYANAAVSS
jgi:putative ABC transport system ATP-binding protein